MTVLHLLGADEDTGGILSVLRNLQSAATSQDVRHVVWVNRAYKETRQPPLSYRYSRHLLAESPRHLALLLRALASVPELLRLQCQEQFDVWHAHSRGAFPLVALLALAGTNVLFTNHAYARRTRMYRLVARLPHCHSVCLTPNMARHYGIPAGLPRLHIISACCADLFFNLPLPERPVPNGPMARARFAGLGNIVRWKNWHLALEAIGALRPEERARVMFDHYGPICADGDSQAYSESLRETMRRLRLEPQCRFHGAIPGVERALAEADWFILPSTNEPCSVALIEALAMGIPVVASASGGNVDIVEPEQTGLLFKPGDVQGLVVCLRRILAGDVKLKSRAQLRESVRGRSASNVASQYLALYRCLCKAPQR